MAEVEPRILAAWRQWLSALASDPEAAIAAAQVYAALSPEGRDAWLAALEEDAPRLGVPMVALYAPLLSVELDPDRLERMFDAVRGGVPSIDLGSTLAYRGFAPDRSQVTILVAPLYVDFVQVLSCRFTPHRGFEWVHLDPIVRSDEAPKAGAKVDGIAVERTPLPLVVEELALAVLAQRRLGHEMPSSMVGFAGLFDARLDYETTS